MGVLAFFVGKPLRIEPTSGTAMNSSAIPARGGRSHVMADMRTRVDPLADGTGAFMGRDTRSSGEGVLQ